MLTWIVDFLQNFAPFSFKATFSVIEYLFDLFYDFVEPYLLEVIDAIPNLQPMWDFLSPIAPYTAFINQFIALDTALLLIPLYFTFVSVMISVKLIIKLFVPTVG